jgi:SAM-dependent methyltransferase
MSNTPDNPSSDSSIDESTRAFTTQNRRAWEEIADVRQAMWQPASFFAQGGTLLDPRVLAAAGDIAGRSVLHLQCATGEETLSWAVAGARATGVDISPRQVELAQRKAADAGLSVRFVASDVYDVLRMLAGEPFDVVYTGGGALVWLPDLARWAGIVAGALRPGGRLILYEEHPVAGCLWYSEGRMQIESDYFGRGKPEEVRGWSHFNGGEYAQEIKYEFVWPLGDVVTAVARAGLRIESLDEFPSQARWRFGEKLDEARALPGEFLLIATKP